MRSAQWLYRYFIFPLMFLIFKFMSLFNKKIKAGLQARKNNPWLAPAAQGKPWVWIHVSSGEFEYAKPLLRSLKALNTHRILVTYFSPSVKDSLSKSKDVDQFVPMPWDTPRAWDGFLNHYNPRILAIARTDIWPEMIWSTQRRRVPIYLFSATLDENSFKQSFWARWFFKRVFESLSHVSAVSKEDVENLKAISPQTSASVDGDTRFDQVFFRLQEKRHLKPFMYEESEFPSFVAGSTWPEDEKVLLPGLLSPIRKGLRVIIAPHEPTESHLKSIEAFFKKNYIDTTRYSLAATWPDRHVLLIDQVGILADLYRHASVAFVGGSFKKSIHSVMEPAACGCLVLMGPKHLNNREASLLKNEGKALVFHSSRNFEDFLVLELATQDIIRNNRRERIMNAVKSCQGATETVKNRLLKLVTESQTKLSTVNRGSGVNHGSEPKIRS